MGIVANALPPSHILHNWVTSPPTLFQVCQKPCFWSSSLQLFHFSLPARSTFTYPIQLFMFLMKLRLNTPFQDLAYRFHVTPKTARKTFHIWLQHLAQLAKGLVTFPTQEVARSWLTDKDYGLFPRLRCIIDCSEVVVAR